MPGSSLRLHARRDALNVADTPIPRVLAPYPPAGSHSGMTPEQCDKITKDWNVYLTRNGRISMAGVTSKNVERLAEAIHTVTK